jgi:sugar (pentulose or hexulose) kinase
VVAGGWARNPAVRSVKRALLGPFDWPRVTQAGARGAALLAGVAAGRYAGIGDLPEPDRPRAAPVGRDGPGRRPATASPGPERSPR